MFQGCCRYFQQLVDGQIETARAKGELSRGVQFLKDRATLSRTQPVWRQPHTAAQEAAGEDAQRVMLASVQTEVGCSWEEAVDAMEYNKQQIQQYSSRVHERDVGFYIRRCWSMCLALAKVDCKCRDLPCCA